MIHFEIPWNSPAQWKEISQTLSFLIERYSDDLTPAFQAAENIRQNLNHLFPIMDRLCADTCTDCKEPCCRVAKLWYNYQDLLFLSLSGLQPPEDGQPIQNYHGHCRYLGSTGCTLPRINRPWICTWYICPPQTSILRRNSRVLYNEVEEVIQNIKAARKEMESELIEVVSKI